MAQNNSRTLVNVPLLEIPSLPEVRIRDISIPSAPGLNRAERLQKVKLQCPLIQVALPSLVLKGSRIDQSLINLEWIAKNAYSFERFFIERSLGDTLHFETIDDRWAKTIAGIRDEYNMPDDNNYENLSYYRVKVTLQNGNYIYSNVAEVKGYTTKLLSLYPNPASSYLNLSLRSSEQGAGVISIIDMSGKKLKMQTVTLLEGLNHQQLKLSGLIPGVYTVNMVFPSGNTLSGNFLKL